MALQRAERLRPNDAVHGQLMLGLEGANRAARLRSEDSVGGNTQRPLESFDRSAAAPHSQKGASLLATSRACKRRARLRTDDAVHEEAMSSLERPDRRACPRPEDAVGVDAEGALNLGNFRATASEAQLDVGARDSGGPSPAVSSALNGKRGGHGGHEE
jgi:hypothetical protein